MVGRTVTVVPSTLTSKKWKTWPSEVGREAAPQALPWVLEEYDHPIAYASIDEQWLTGSRSAPPPPVTYDTGMPPPDR